MLESDLRGSPNQGTKGLVRWQAQFDKQIGDITSRALTGSATGSAFLFWRRHRSPLRRLRGKAGDGVAQWQGARELSAI